MRGRFGKKKKSNGGLWGNPGVGVHTVAAERTGRECPNLGGGSRGVGISQGKDLVRLVVAAWPPVHPHQRGRA